MKKQKNVEVIGFDLRPIIKSHPEHAAIIKWAAKGSNPRYVWGVQTAKTLVQRHGEMQGLFAFEGETAEQRDRRVIADMREDLFEHLSFYNEGYGEDLSRLLFTLKPSYYYVYYVDGKAAKKVLNRRKPVYDSGTAPLDFDQLLQARAKLENFLLETYGDSGFFTPLQSEPRKTRFAVFVCEAGLNVKVTLTSKEGKFNDVNVDGVPFAHFVARVPDMFESFAVKTNYWTLDKSFCDPE
ncbi:MAG: hypothetical protein P4L53_23015 [Candidatus Obscuribacterales bacterium]|nr:hypothetical protein [Candidatus Obscuribacterales bacterium]